MSKESESCLTDIGVNFTSNKFKSVGIDTLIKNARKSGVSTIIGISNSNLDVPKNVATCKKHADVYCTAGVHPHSVKHLNTKRFEELRSRINADSKLGNKRNIVAIGECGLDFNRNFSTPESQKYWFKKQLYLSKAYGLPLYLHCRDAFDDFIKILNDFEKDENYSFGGKAVVHCFTGTKDELNEYIKCGYYFGVTGWICDNKRAKNLIDAIKSLDRETLLKHVLIETDSPWLTPKGLNPRPKYNIPDNVAHVVTKLAEVTGIDKDTLVSASYNNCRKLFRLNE